MSPSLALFRSPFPIPSFSSSCPLSGARSALAAFRSSFSHFSLIPKFLRPPLAPSGGVFDSDALLTERDANGKSGKPGWEPREVRRTDSNSDGATRERKRRREKGGGREGETRVKKRVAQRLFPQRHTKRALVPTPFRVGAFGP